MIRLEPRAPLARDLPVERWRAAHVEQLPRLEVAVIEAADGSAAWARVAPFPLNYIDGAGPAELRAMAELLEYGAEVLERVLGQRSRIDEGEQLELLPREGDQG